MNTDFAFVCDHAEAGAKINALGIGFDTIYSVKVPAKHGHFSFVMQLRTTVVEVGQKRFEIHIIDADGKDIIPPVRNMIQLQMREGTSEAVARIVMEFANVEFPHYGTYSVKAAIDGIEMSSVDFRVAEPPKPKTV